MLIARSILRSLGLLAAASLLNACEGELVVDLTATLDEDSQRVVIAVPSVDLLDSSGGVTSLDTDSSATFDLLDYQDGERLRLLSLDSEDDGSYIGIRPHVDEEDAYVLTADGERIAIDIVTQGDYASFSFDVDDSSSVSIVLEMDLRFSLIDRLTTRGVYELLPVVRAIDADTAGSIAGIIDTDVVEDDSCRDGRATGTGVAVYLYEGGSVTPVDYVSDGTVVATNPPIASASAYVDDADDLWHYRFAYVAPGTYTLALTCEADDEDPSADDDLEFIDSATTTVEEATSISVDF